MTNLARIAGSFVIVLVVYGTYSVTAVPMIEPSLAAGQPATLPPGVGGGTPGGTNPQIAELDALFPPGSLRIENPKILQSDRVKLLIGDYQTDADGNVHIKPCAIILVPEPDGLTHDEQLRRAIVLEAPEGARLQFHDRFDLARLRIGRLESSRLKGPITIRSAGKTDSPDDDLWVVTRDVELSEELVSTRHPVRFRYGPHYGSGRGMRIRLLPGDSASSPGRGGQGPNVAGLESFELAQLDGLHLRVPPKSMALGADAPTSTTRGVPGNERSEGQVFHDLGHRSAMTQAPRGPQELQAPGNLNPQAAKDVPVDITCAGPFRFDAVKQQATFERNVVVTSRRGDAGGPDQLKNCDRLSVYFRQRAAAKPAPGDGGAQSTEDSSGPGNLEPWRLEAVGRPVMFSAPSDSVEGRAERLQYNLITKNLALDGDRSVFLRKGTQQIEARSLRYWSPEPPWQFGRMAAEGPGWIRASADDRPDDLFEARWNGRLQFQPYQQNQVVSFTGGASLAYGAIGQLSAGEIHFYLKEVPAAPGSRRATLRPDRMQADGNVQLGSAQVSGEVEQLQVWFEQPASASGEPAGQIASSTAATGASASGGGAAPADSPPSEQPPQRHFHVTARLLQARVILRDRGEKSDVDELTLTDRVSLVQTQTATSGEKPVVVRGESIHVKDASKPHAALGIKGRPAYFEGRGLTIVGSNINLNAGTNRLWIDGPGFMDLPPPSRDLQGRPTSTKDPLRVDWQDRMEFDGRTVHFEGKVRATSRLQQLLTETLDACLDRTVRFAQAEKLNDPGSFDIEQIRCPGHVWMESRSMDEKNPDLLQSYEQMETQNLVINKTTGALAADGPGWIRSTSRGSGGLGQWSGLGGQQPATAPADDPGASNSLTYLYVRFLGGITGNIRQGEITLHDQVRAVYGPVASWDVVLPEDDPDAWGPSGGLLSTDALTVREMPLPVGEGKSRELEAIGNTRIEGQDFAAFCTRMSYDQHKGMMLLEGDGRTPATLLRQKGVGSYQSKGSAQWFRFWPKTKTVESSGVGPVEINQFDQRPSPKR